MPIPSLVAKELPIPMLIMAFFEAKNMDMPRKIRFRPRKAKSVPLKVDKSCRAGRTYEDFLQTQVRPVNGRQKKYGKRFVIQIIISFIIQAATKNNRIQTKIIRGCPQGMPLLQ